MSKLLQHLALEPLFPKISVPRQKRLSDGLTNNFCNRIVPGVDPSEILFIGGATDYTH